MLLFWDIIFASIPGVFETPYQSAPLDLGSDAFYVGMCERENDLQKVEIDRVYRSCGHDQ